MNLHYTCGKFTGLKEIIEPAAGEGIMGFSLLSLEPGSTFSADSGPYETVMVILGGRIEVRVDGQSYGPLGGRQNVFDGKATALYIPRESAYLVTARESCETALCRVRAEKKYAPFVVEPREVAVHHRGEQLWQREVHDIITGNGQGRVDRLIVGETFNAPGNWSSFPPHKHDCTIPGREAELREIYHYRLEPTQLFGVQVIYKEKDTGANQAFLIRHRDSVYIPGGYHPVAAPPGVKLYYLWFLAGTRGRELLPCDDPAFIKLLGRSGQENTAPGS